MRTRPGRVETEIYFRIVHHVAGGGGHGAPVADILEQTVEIGFGPKGAFENGNIATLTRQVPANRVVRAIRPGQCKPKPVKVPKAPRVVELLRKATEWRRELDAGEVRNQADSARREGFIRAMEFPLLLAMWKKIFLY